MNVGQTEPDHVGGMAGIVMIDQESNPLTNSDGPEASVTLSAWLNDAGLAAFVVP
ncbi:MAG: hypothetical protein ACLPUO_06970 [Streptosporangiaceae bacterium]|jgi:hypothetical protein